MQTDSILKNREECSLSAPQCIISKNAFLTRYFSYQNIAHLVLAKHLKYRLKYITPDLYLFKNKHVDKCFVPNE